MRQRAEETLSLAGKLGDVPSSTISVPDRPEAERILRYGSALIENLRQGLLENRIRGGSPEEFRIYDDLVAQVLYYTYRDRFQEILDAVESGNGRAQQQQRALFERFRRDVEHWSKIPSRPPGTLDDVPHLFSCCYQIRRAYHSISQQIFGTSTAITELRAEVFNSIFTFDLNRYVNSVYRTMPDVTTLITGPSGSGKELVAQAIGLSRYIPFDTQRSAFVETHLQQFYAVNLAALSPTLIESEMFGHAQGAFTGAVEAKPGIFEGDSPTQTVFLDEIGDLDPSVQVKLLRVLQSRRFQRIGELEERTFAGRLIAATNRDLIAEMRAGRFRADLYYRLCSHVIRTPSLKEQVDESPDHLEAAVAHVCRRIVPEIAEELAGEAATPRSELPLFAETNIV